jgi:hypothetical protein
MKCLYVELFIGEGMRPITEEHSLMEVISKLESFQ